MKKAIYILTMTIMDSIFEENLKIFASGFMKQQEDYANSLNEKTDLKRRIETMQNLMDYNLDVIDKAIQLWEEKSAKKAMEYLSENYIIWDDVQYEEMEKYEDSN